MKKKCFRDILILLIATIFTFLATMMHRLLNPTSPPSSSTPIAALSAQPSLVKTKGKIINRNFTWYNRQNQEIITLFHIPEKALKEEIKKFGFNPAFTHAKIREKKGFKIIGRKNILVNNRLQEQLITMIDYQKVFNWSKKYFPDLTRMLISSTRIPAGSDPLHTLLTFVQALTYKQPPRIYRSKFINHFFTPIVCLVEQYGDCDSKSILLAEFIATSTISQEKTAIILVRQKGLSHALLAIKRNPLPGMTSLFLMNKGYFIVLEASTTGWAPGFISHRIMNALRGGNFSLIEL